jgi:hypothetical protein
LFGYYYHTETAQVLLTYNKEPSSVRLSVLYLWFSDYIFIFSLFLIGSDGSQTLESNPNSDEGLNSDALGALVFEFFMILIVYFVSNVVHYGFSGVAYGLSQFMPKVQSLCL